MTGSEGPRPATRIGLIAIIVVFIGAGWLGADFGNHWDEHWIVNAWKRTVATRSYQAPSPYPGLYYDLSLPTLAFEAIRLGDAEALHERVLSKPFRIAVRLQYVVLTATSIWITFAIVRRWRRSDFEALTAAAALGLSWQLSYHSRWIATDALLPVFAPLAVLLCMDALRRPDRLLRCLLWASVAAGLATAGKYAGGAAALPIGWIALRGGDAAPPWSRRIARACAAGAVFTVTFLVASPQVLLDWSLTLESIQAMARQYATGHLGHTVDAGFAHAGRMARYLAGDLLSPFLPVALALSALAILGGVRIARERSEQAWVFALTPLVYFAYFAMQRVMVVRNLLVLAPFVAVLCGIGAGVAMSWLRGRGASWVLAAGLAIAFGANAAWLVDSANSVRGYEVGDSVARLAREIEARPADRFLVTGKLASTFDALGLRPETDNWQIAQLSGEIPDDVEVGVLSLQYRVVFYTWPANERGRYADFGPREVDWDYYPGWPAQERAVLVPGDVFRTLRVPRKRVNGPDEETPE